MQDRGLDVALHQFRQVEPGTEMITRAADHHRLHRLGQVQKRGVDLADQRVADGVALGRAVQPHMGHRVGLADLQQVQRGQHAGDGGEIGTHRQGHLVKWRKFSS